MKNFLQSFLSGNQKYLSRLQFFFRSVEILFFYSEGIIFVVIKSVTPSLPQWGSSPRGAAPLTPAGFIVFFNPDSDQFFIFRPSFELVSSFFSKIPINRSA